MVVEAKLLQSQRPPLEMVSKFVRIKPLDIYNERPLLERDFF